MSFGRIWAVFPAAGLGSRAGGALPKQYRVVAGRPMIEYAIDPFLTLADLVAAVVVLAADDQRWQLLPLSRDARIETVTGGEQRHHSVLAGLRHLRGRATDQDWVIVHDVARPCVDSALVLRLLETLQGDEVGGLLAIPVADTLKSSRDGCRVEATVDRSLLWRAQTPQMFRFGALHAAMEATLDAEPAVTDEAAALERAGLHPRLVPGSETNLKVTRAEDFDLAALLLQRSAPTCA